MSFSLKKIPLPVIVTVVHAAVLVLVVACSGKIVVKPREVKVRVNLNSGELMTAPEVGEPEIKVGGGEPEPPAPAPEPPKPEPPKPPPPKPEPPKPDIAKQQRQKKLAEEQRRKKLIRDRQKKLAEKQRQKRLIRERQKKLAEKQRQQRLIRERQRKIAEQRRQQEMIRKRQQELNNQRKKANSGVHHDSSWDNPNNIPAGNRNRGQRRGPMQKNPKIGGDSRAEDRYFAMLPDFFRGKWSVPPGILAGDDSSVLVELTVAADGRLLKYLLVQRSPYPAVNDSVEQMFRQLNRIPAPPNGAIKFKLRLNADML